MADTFDIPAWIILFIGLYSLAAGVGELRAPGTWAAMLDDFERQAGLRCVTGFAVLAVGAAVYLVNPWRPNDWLAILASVLGGLMVVEGALILASGERVARFGQRMMARGAKGWAGGSALAGAALIAAALSRL